MLQRIVPQSLYYIHRRPRKSQILYILNVGLISNNDWPHYSGLCNNTINCSTYTSQLCASCIYNNF
jgi:hypothetical protein